MRNLMVALLVMQFVLTAGTVHAGERAGAFTLCPFVGGYTFDGAESMETQPVYGVRLGYSFTKNLGIEGTFGYLTTHFTNHIPGTTEVYNYRLEGIYSFMPDKALVPYLTIGGGGTSLEMPDDPRITRAHNHSPTVNVGGGIKWFFNKNLALRADFHQNFLIDTNDERGKVEDFLMNYEYTLGLQIYFGGT